MPRHWRGRIRLALNRLIEPLGVTLVPSSESAWWKGPRKFRFGGTEYALFCHAYNCGWPPYATERTVELALADRWLDRAASADVLEVGAVTPYYWPGRVREVVDPADPHPAVSRREPVSRVDLRGRTVLSISTFEHVGTGEYGMAPDGDDAVRALGRLLRDAARFLVTLPMGANPLVDSFLLGGSASAPGATVRFLVRDALGRWTEEPAARARRPYGDETLLRRHRGAVGNWANAVAILERGGLV